MSQSNSLHDVYAHPAIREFGRSLRLALWRQKDFSSLVELDGAERPDEFAEALKRFLRRFDALARRQNLHRPTQQRLEEVTGLIDLHGVKIVRAAIISHALVASTKQGLKDEVPGELVEEESNGSAS